MHTRCTTIVLIGFVALLPKNAVGAEDCPRQGVNWQLQALSDDYTNADCKLNAEYKRLLASLPKIAKVKPGTSDLVPTRTDLIKAQRDWLKFRDSWCHYVGLSKKIENQGWYAAGELECLANITKLRVEELHNFVR